MKIIIFGATEIGNQIARDFFETNDITVLDSDKAALKLINDLDISSIEGSGTNISMLKLAGIEKADAFIACSDSDEANIVACMAAKTINNVKTMCFIQKQESYEALMVAKDSEYDTFNIDYIIWLKDLLTEDIFRVVTNPIALDYEQFSGGRANLIEYKVSENDFLAGKRLKECDFPSDVLIVGITRESNLYIPDGDTVLLPDDKAVFIGLHNALNILLAKHSSHKNRKKVKSVAIIGGGTLSRMLAKELEKLNLKLKIIEPNLERCNYLFTQLRGSTMVINGDGTDLTLLETENIKDSDVVIAITDNDEKNLLCSLYCKQLGVKKIITRVSNYASIDLFEKVGIDIVISVNDAINRLVRNSFIEKNFGVLAMIERGQGELIEVEVGSKFDNILVKDLVLPVKVVIAIVEQNKKIIIPKGDTALKKGAKLTLFTLCGNVEKIINFFKDSKE